MCKKAKEIQKLRTPKDGDFALFDDEITIIYNCGIGTWSRGYTWLPRQDQLQGIWLDEFNNLTIEDLIGHFNLWIEELPIRRSPNYLKWSMEQLWLAFVMKEKYQKTWDGKDWVENV